MWKARRFVLSTAAIIGIVAVGAMPTAGADEIPVSCGAGADWNAIRSFIQSGQRGEVPALPLTTFLPAEDSARILFHKPLSGNVGDHDTNAFRVYEVADATKLDLPEALPILSVQPAPDRTSANAIPGFGPGDSTVLEVAISERALSLWPARNFIVLGCEGGTVQNWSLVTARVSSRQLSVLVCGVLALAMYFWAMSSVRVSRKTANPLATKYPAIFGVRRIDWADFLNPIHLTANAFNKASVPKLQVLLFSFLVGWLVLSMVLRTGALMDLSLTVVGLLGISGVGAAVAQKTNQQITRLSLDNWAWLHARGVLREPVDTEGPRWRDLVLTNREFDVYKLQTIIFTVAVAAAMVGAGASHLATFAVPETLLGILGLSQVVYIGGLLVRPPATADLDDALTKLRAAEGATIKAVQDGTDVDKDWNLLPGGNPGASLEIRTAAAANALQFYKQMADRVAVMIESALEVEADRRRLDAELASVAVEPRIRQVAS